MKISLKEKKLPWKSVRDYLSNPTRLNGLYNITLRNILDYSTNPISALNMINSSRISRDNLELINQSLSRCQILNEKINFSWSLKRLQKNLVSLNQRIKEIELYLTDPTPIKYEGKLPLLDNMTLVDNQTLVYKLGLKEKWNLIKRKRNFIIIYNHNGTEYIIDIFKNRFLNGSNDINFQIITKPHNLELVVNLPDEIMQNLNEWFDDGVVNSFFVSQEIDNTVSDLPNFVGNDIPFDNENDLLF